ncbi:hypothetical protein [uncultured Gulosibacter sp.]|uniref:hypothetical protein n=1 Tax=uncultured Gulosibacter sp. TaxID=1339167 RepID=UPI00288B1899|nr:hypothetical protein [uncultured Gulosibacter sp.]
MSAHPANEPEADRSVFVNSPVPVRLLGLVVAVEALFMLFIAGLLVVELMTETPNSLASSIGLVVIAVIAVAALTATLVGIAHRQSWTRSFTLVWQVLQVAAAVVVLQGDMADTVGWVLAVVSLAGLVLVFNPKVTAWLRPDEEPGR